MPVAVLCHVLHIDFRPKQHSFRRLALSPLAPAVIIFILYFTGAVALGLVVVGCFASFFTQSETRTHSRIRMAYRIELSVVRAATAFRMNHPHGKHRRIVIIKSDH